MSKSWQKLYNVHPAVVAALICRGQAIGDELTENLHFTNAGQATPLTSPWEPNFLTVPFHAPFYLFFYLPRPWQLCWQIRAWEDKSKSRDVGCICVQLLDLLSTLFKPEIIAKINSASDSSFFFFFPCLGLTFSLLPCLALSVILYFWGRFLIWTSSFSEIENVDDTGTNLCVWVQHDNHINTANHEYVFLAQNSVHLNRHWDINNTLAEFKTSILFMNFTDGAYVTNPCRLA